ncbi:hypothetical protein [Paraburkholderia kururiensis]|uniref:hypothetical protein n=1 Tax=Paraburkholderia kururiensis TaxID=984307 RepID=UPI000B251C6E|nr:hypothetical protein [Paraburkholderia kururiensis]
MSILQTVVFQFKCLFLGIGIGIDVENFADEREIESVTDLDFNADNIAPKIGRGDLAAEIGRSLDAGGSY